MEEVYEYLKKCGVFYVATVEGDQPRVRPFGVVDLFEGRLYIQTGNVKAVFAQMKANPKIEICGMADPNSWIRVSATAVQDDRREARKHMLDENSMLRAMYNEDDGNCEVLYLKDATARFCAFGQPERTVTF